MDWQAERGTERTPGEEGQWADYLVSHPALGEATSPKTPHGTVSPLGTRNPWRGPRPYTGSS